MSKILAVSIGSLILTIFHSNAVGENFLSDNLVAKTSGYEIKIEKSETDKSKYRYIKLPNQMKVLLISDASSDKSGVSLDVFVGSSHDPVKRQGLAHFLEHMLFLGTDKYPDPDEYQAFISQNGGQHNAYTSFEHTNYFFDIDPQGFESGLDRFSRFFVAPLFNTEYVDREMNAVHSEYRARINNDYRRQRDVFSQTVNPSHPAAKFSVGNLDILSNTKDGSVRDDLLAFYRKHYSANRMALVVLAPMDLDELELMVRAKFSEVKNSNSIQLEHKEPLFTVGALPLLLSIKPVQELRELTVTFPLPPMDKYYREKPLSYIANFVGDEGKGSLLSLLKGKGWAEALSAGEGFSDLSGSSFDIRVKLTPVGASNWKQVTSLIFQQIEVISKNGGEKWRWLEQAALADIAFRYKELGSPIHRVSRLAAQLHQYPPEKVMRGPYLLDRYNPGLIEEVLTIMTPDNALITIMAPEVKTDKVSKLYKVPYKLEKLTGIERAEKTKFLTLPSINKFVPDGLKIKGLKGVAPAGLPTLLSDMKNYRLWHYLDAHYQMPKAQFYSSIKLGSVKNASDAAMLELYLKLVDERLNESNYAAALAGLNYSIYRQADGIGFFVSGFDSKLSYLAEEIANGLLAPIYKGGYPKKSILVNNSMPVSILLERLRNELIRDWRNKKKQSPYKQLLAESFNLIDATGWSSAQLADALSDYNEKKFAEFVRKLFVGATIEFLASGNIGEVEAKNIASNIAQNFEDMPYKDWVNRSVYKISTGEKINSHMSVDHNDFAILRYYQGRNDSEKETAGIMVLKQLIGSDFFHELRTEQQLGYIVAAVDRTVDRVPGIGLLVQSPEVSINELESAIDRFLINFLGKLKSMSREDFNQQKEAVLARLQEKPKSLAEHSARFWASIEIRDYSFNRRKKLMMEIKELTYNEALEMYDYIMVKSGYSLQVDSSSGTLINKKEFEKDRLIFSLPPHKLKNKN